MDLSLRTIRKNIAALSVFAIIASMLVVTGVVNAAAADVYQDVDGTEWYAENATWGLDNGVLDSTQAYFRAGDNASRAEFFTMVARGAGIPEATCDESLFPDLNADHWGCPYITAMFEAEIVSGDGAGSATPGYVRPDDNILRAEAAKVVVEAFQLDPVDGKLGSDVFTDVPVGIWYDSYMGIANENCVFQGVNNTTVVEPARQINRAESVTVVKRGANPTTDCAVAVEAGDLTVSVDGSTPDAAYIPQNGSNIPYSVFAFTASSEEKVNVDQIVVTRSGLGLPGDFKNLKVYVDGVQKGTEKTLSTSTNTATFSFSSSPIAVPAGSTVLVEVRADMDPAAAVHSQNQLCIAGSGDVLATGDASSADVAVGGVFAVCGNLMTTTSANVGQLTYVVSQPTTGQINIGDTDISFAKIRLDMATEDADLTRVTFRQGGSADAEYFANLVLKSSGTVIASNPVWDGKYVSFDLSGSPLLMAKGTSKNLELYGDVVGGLNTTVQFDIYRDWHIEATGRVYGYGVNVVEGGGSISPLNRDIVGGNVAFAVSANNPIAGDVSQGAQDHEFLRFNISTGGDAISVKKLQFTVTSPGAAGLATEIEDLKVWMKKGDTWMLVMGPNDIAAMPQTVVFTDSFDVPAGSTVEFKVTADITNGAVNGHDFAVGLDNVNTTSEIEYSDGTGLNEATEVTGGALGGNTQTVAQPRLDVSLSATPGDKTYVRNTIGSKELVAFDMKASTASDVKVTGLTVNCTAIDVLGAPTPDCFTAFNTLELYRIQGSTRTKLDPSARPMIKAGVNGDVTFNTNHVIPKGEVHRFLVMGVIPGSAVETITDAGDEYRWSIANASTKVNADVENGTVNILPAALVGNRIIDVAINGTLTNQILPSVDTASRMLLGLSENEGVLSVRLSADALEGWVLQKLTLNDVAGSDADTSNVYVSYKNKAGETKKVAGVFSSSTYQFTGLDAYVAPGSTATLYFTVDVGNVTDGGALTGDVIQIQFAAAGYEAKGESSGATWAGAVVVTGEQMRIAKSAPTVSKVALASGTLVNGADKELYKMTIEASNKGDIALKYLTFDVNLTDIGGGALSLSNFKLYRGTTDISQAAGVTLYNAAWSCVENVANVEPYGGLCGTTIAATNQVLVVFDDGTGVGEEIISAGTSNTYTLVANIAGADTTGESVSVSPVYDNTGGAAGDLCTIWGNFMWSDWSDKVTTDLTPAHSSDWSCPSTSSSDWLDGWLVPGLNAAGAQTLNK